MEPETEALLVAAILGSGGVFSIIQFFITFGFSRKDKQKEIENELKATRQEQKEELKAIRQEQAELRNEIQANAAILARTHILRFSDELKNGIEHSAEYFRQQLDDCDTYERYCATHPEFKNSYTEVANKHIKETFERLTREGKV